MAGQVPDGWIRMFPRLNMWPKFVLSSVIILTPMVILGYLLVQENVSQSKQQMLQESALASDLVASSANGYLQSSKSLLKSAAQSPEIVHGNIYESEAALGRLYLQQPEFRNIFLVDLQKEEVSASLFHSPELSLAPDVLAFLKSVASTEEARFSDRIFYQSEKLPVVMIGVPIRDDSGRYTKVLSGLLSMSRLQLELGMLTAGKDISIVIVDSRGGVLVHPNWDYVYAGEDLSGLGPVQASLSGQQGVMEYRAPDGELELAAYQPIPATTWGVFASKPVEVAYGPAQQALTLGLLYIGGALVVAVLLGVLFGRILLEPLRQLAKRLTSMGFGDSKEGSTQDTGDEFFQLNHAVGTMWTRLQQNLDELDSTRHEIQAKSAQLQSMLSRLSRAQEEERKRIAQDIHDGLSQFAYLALLNARRSEKLMGTDSEEALRRLRLTEELLDQAVIEIRDTIYRLEPPTRKHGGLIPALERCIKTVENTGGVPCELQISGIPVRLRCEEETAVYRIVQEALNNALQHSRASVVSVSIDYRDAEMTTTVRDNGNGFEPGLALEGDGQHFGLSGMRERAAAVGANLAISSSRELGTEVSLSLRHKGGRQGRKTNGKSAATAGR